MDTVIIDLTDDGLYLSTNISSVSLKRVVIDLTDDDENMIVVKRPRHDYVNQAQLTRNLQSLPRVLVAVIFKDYLSIDLIKEVLTTPTNILRTSVYLHQSLMTRTVPKNILNNFNSLSRFIITHIGYKMPLFITFAIVNKRVLSSLQINDTFDYYEAHRTGKYIVLKVLKNRAIVQKIRCNDSKLIYNGMKMETVSKVAQKKSINFKILNDRCIFSSIQKQNVCFLNKNGLPVEVSYFTDDGCVNEKHVNMGSYTII